MDTSWTLSRFQGLKINGPAPFFSFCTWCVYSSARRYRALRDGGAVCRTVRRTSRARLISLVWVPPHHQLRSANDPGTWVLNGAFATFRRATFASLPSRRRSTRGHVQTHAVPKRNPRTLNSPNAVDTCGHKRTVFPAPGEQNGWTFSESSALTSSQLSQSAQ